jgi:hypothetical protein
MTRDPLTQLQIADLSLKVPVQVTYGKNSENDTVIKDVRVVHGPLSLDITALLTEDDFFDAFEQLHDWYVDNGPLPATITSEETSND